MENQPEERHQLPNPRQLQHVDLRSSSPDDIDGRHPVGRRDAETRDVQADQPTGSEDHDDVQPVPETQNQASPTITVKYRDNTRRRPQRQYVPDPDSNNSDEDDSPIPCRQQRPEPEPEPRDTFDCILRATCDDVSNNQFVTFVVPGDYRAALTGDRWQGLLTYHPPRPRPHHTGDSSDQPGPSTSGGDTQQPAILAPLEAEEGHTHITFPNPGQNKMRTIQNILRILCIPDHILSTALITYQVIRNIGRWLAYLSRFGLQSHCLSGKSHPGIKNIRRILTTISNLPIISRLQHRHQAEGDDTDGGARAPLRGGLICFVCFFF